jgi:hypothetical protein
LYINGVLKGTVAQPGSITDYIGIDFSIGGKTENNTQNFRGRIDEVRILNKAKTAEWILTEFNNQNIPTAISIEGPHSNYDFGTFCQNSFISYSVPDIWTSYSWNVTGGNVIYGDGTDSVNVKWTDQSGGTIFLEVSDGSTNDQSPAYDVSIDAAPVASITPDSAIVCPGSDVNFNGNPSGGSGIFTDYDWKGSGADSLNQVDIVNPVFVSATPGDFKLILQVTDNKGCNGSDSTWVFVSDTINP